MRSRSSIWLFIGLVFGLPVLVYLFVNAYESRLQKLPVIGPAVEKEGKMTDHRIHDFSLINQDGRQITTSEWDNKIVIADFFFTRCPSVCPQMTRSMKRVQKSFNDNAGLQFASFSVDPYRDSMEVLQKYSRKYELDNRNWNLITGDKKTIYALARNSFMLVAADGDGGAEDFIHSEKLVLLDAEKRIRGYYNGTNEKEVTQLIRDIKKLKDEK
ncbi:MAG: SCO family protein [Chitinophagaceae bacterium]|nr:SCO family protein [Chitinophagaceae bacterium]